MQNYSEVLESYLIPAEEALSQEAKDKLVAGATVAGLVGLSVLWDRASKKRDAKNRSKQYNNVDFNKLSLPEMKNITEIVISKRKYNFLIKHGNELAKALDDIDSELRRAVSSTHVGYSKFTINLDTNNILKKYNIMKKDLEESTDDSTISITNDSELNKLRGIINALFKCNNPYSRFVELDWGGYDQLEEFYPDKFKQLKSVLVLEDKLLSLIKTSFSGIKVRNDYTKK